ncbi:PRAME family member 12-like [Sorex araneus]|uniref:PRAME family member 12-like n=1 Tax=Sorex araneus TaxID=42254 RepID=UPI002433A141|nr:PRAME family member 12-like [Sorex araneus]
MSLLSSFLEKIHSRPCDPPSLLQLVMRSLLAEEAQIISALQDLPVALLPQLFLEAYARRYKAALKVMVQDWPFRCLPLGCFIEDLLTEYFRINAVLDGLDALLTQKVRSRCLRTSLETLSLTECPLLEQDMTHLCQCANLTQLKELSLRGTSLSLVREPLRMLPENCAPTLQDLDLGICGLQDSHLEAILPALKLCSQLSVLSFYGNSVSMATLVQMLHHLAGLPHLTLEVYPAPQESYIAPNTLHQRTFDLLCAELRGVLRDLGKPRSILLSTMSCSCCGKIMFHNCEPMLFPVSCYNGLIQKISFPN